MASARQINGRWYYRINIISNGKKKQLTRGGYATKREALDAGTKVEAEFKENKQIFSPKKITFHDLAKEWIEEYAPMTYRETSIRNAKQHLNMRILPYLKDYYISSITPRMCQEIINTAVKNGYALTSIKRVQSCLNQCFAYAVRSGYLKTNPAKEIYLPHVRSKAMTAIKPPREHRIMPKEEVLALFQRFPEDNRFYIPLILGYRCGLRLGEAFGLLVDDVDFVNGKLHIRQQIQYTHIGGELYFTPPKYCNRGEGRDIDLDKDTLRILKKHINKINACFLVLDYPQYYIDENNHLSTTHGKPIQPINIRVEDGTFLPPRTIQYVARVVHGKCSKFSYVDPLWDFHCLRHTHTSDCIAAGMSPVSVQHRLGHKNLQTTYKYYVHETDIQVTESRDILKKMYE